MANTMFEENLLEILDEMVPLKKRQIKKNHSDWVTAESRKLMKDRDKARDWARTTQNDEDW